MSDKTWYDEKHGIWVLLTTDRGLFFQPGPFDYKPSDHLWAVVPDGLATIALPTSPDPDKRV